ncbi:hypothetical protein M3147_11805 [Agromyces mediolanus]|uniref:hypothetical protein n=1 Tax=Agromyces mediolanus TaxID=41986 RepID=UPI00203CEFED|nr:hypothetical protein [Agromyces mediolanus]MCM3657936.1 hypothetical protein [Agromyces mediolanus]
MRLDDERLAAAVLERVIRAASPDLVWEAATASKGSIRIVYRSAAEAPLIGRTFDLARLRTQFDPSTPAALAQVILDELRDPTDPGPLHEPEYDAALVPGKGPVGWWPSP